jgi:thioredoxin-related protein
MKFRNKLAMACLLVGLLPGFAFTALAQQEGIQFEKGLSWQQIKEKAKKENKYIFMDCYATWCAPCKLMSDSVFTRKEVGDVFNKKFINVKVQLDQTAKDNEEVKSWYQDAAAIMKEYGVMSVPNFFYFSPEGKLVHLFVGTTKDTRQFIDISEKAFDPSTQYFTQMEAAIKAAGNHPDSLKKLAQKAVKHYDGVNAGKLTSAYLDASKGLFTKEHLVFVDEITNSSTDKGFSIFRDNAEKVNAVVGKGVAELKVAKIILQEAGGMNFMADNSKPDFAAIEQKIKAVMPDRTERLMDMLKLHYYMHIKDYDAFTKQMETYLTKYETQLYPVELFGYVQMTLFMNNPPVHEAALTWSKAAIAENAAPQNMAIHSGALFKAGKKEEAIAVLKKAIPMLEKEAGMEQLVNGYSQILKQMESGEL